MRTVLLSLMVVVFSTSFSISAFSQSEQTVSSNYFEKNNPWEFSSEPNLKDATQIRHIIPNIYQTAKVDLGSLKNILAKAPQRFSTEAISKSAILTLPMPDGGFENFKIYETAVMHPALAAKFPEITTYVGQGVDDPTASIYLDLSHKGFNAKIRSSTSGIVYINPYAEGNNIDHTIYYRKDLPQNTEILTCGVDTDPVSVKPEDYHSSSSRMVAGDCQLRTIRLAVATTGEYAQFHGGTVADAMSAVVTAVNQLNGLYELEVAATFELVPNNDQLIFTDPDTDPYTNNSPGAMLNENQTEVDNTIGDANYDLGHVFTTAGGGVAQTPALCSPFGGKARGNSGTSTPIGDVFVFQIAAHEFGHQFSAGHTQNNSDANCQMSNVSSVEPGSGSTIMGYAGICAPNIQNFADHYFNSFSILQMNAWITGDGDCAATSTPGNNSQPSVTTDGPFTIPGGTYFLLEAVGSDPDGQTLMYNWEQNDHELSPVIPPAGTNDEGPMFRSFPPTPDPIRYFPNINEILVNGTPTWEVLPTVDRTMEFVVMVRDNFAGRGCTAEDNVVVTVDGDTGPFLVSAPNTNVDWPANSQQTVTWDVAGTTGGDVNAANVDIFLSTDGGFTYPITVETGVPNDGSHDIMVPNNQTTTARIMVRGSNNIFFDISDENFTISEAAVDYTMEVSPDEQSVCQGVDATYTVEITPLEGFNEDVTFSASDVPAGATATFSPPTVNTSGTTTLTIGNTAAATPGTYMITVSAMASPGTKTETVSLTILPASLGTVTLVSPTDGQMGTTTAPLLSWDEATGATSYDVEVASDAAFSNIVASANVATTSYTVSPPLNVSTMYFWRVKPLNECTEGSFSTAFSFTTSNQVCESFTFTGPGPISAGLIFSTTVNVPTMGTITDIQVLDLDITHSSIQSISVSLESPNPAPVVEFDLVSQVCNIDQQDMMLSFDDEAPNTYGEIPCPPTDGNTYQPIQPLANFIGREVSGAWRLRIDGGLVGAGTLNGFTLNICYADDPEPLMVTATATDETCNGDADGTATATATGGSGSYTYMWSNGGTSSTIVGLAPGDYTVTVNDGTNTATATATVGSPDAVMVTVSSTDSSCGTDDGTATATPAGGDGFYTYNWSNGETTAMITGLAPGTYDVTVTDGSNCTATGSATINQAGNDITIAMSSTDASCGSNDGTATATPSGGDGSYTYNWSNGETTMTISNLAGGTYDVTVTDGAGCTATNSVDVNQVGNTVTVTISATDASCGADDGTATATPAGGDGNYSYNWSNGETTMTISDLAAGTYDVTVTDGAGCIATGSATVNESDFNEVITLVAPADGTMNTSLSPTLVWEAATGADSYDVQVSTSADFSTLVATSNETGTSYTVSPDLDIETTYFWRVRGVSSCGTGNPGAYSAPFSFTTGDGIIPQICEDFVFTGPTPIAPGLITQPILNVGTTGTITDVQVIDLDITHTSIQQISVSLQSPALTEPSLVENICFTDQQDMMLSFDDEAPNPHANIPCPPTDGNTYQPLQPLASFIGEEMNGDWRLRVNGGLIGSGTLNSYTLNICYEAVAMDPLMVTATATDETCVGAADGTATATATDGTGNYTYSWSNGETTAMITGLAPGDYTVTVDDGNETAMATVTVGSPDPIGLTATATDATCGEDNGTATAMTTGGTGAVTFEWSNGETTAMISNLAPGDYTVTATDENSCTETAMVTVSGGGGAVTVTVTSTDTSCGGNDGTATATPAGGDGNYTYNWSNGETTMTITGLAAGDYDVTVTDGAGCSATGTTTVNQTGNTVAVTTTTTDASACGAEDGTATANATGGDGNYTYNWSNGETTMTITGLAAGTYDVTVTDGGSCSATASATVNEPPYDEMITLVSPMDGATDVSTTPTLMWDAAPNADSYDVEVSTTADFATIVASSNETGASYTVSPALMETTTYFWRVRGVSSCGEGPYADPFSFTTGADGGGNEDCTTYPSTDPPAQIPPTGVPIVSIIDVPDSGTITDIDVTDLDITHGFINDLTIILTSPSGTMVTLVNQICNDEDNMFFTLDDEGASPIPCPPIDGNAYQPNNPLSAFDGEELNGMWILTIVDNIPGIDDGTLNGWNLTICTEGAGGDELMVTATATDETCVGAEDGTATATATGGTGNYTYTWSNGEMGAMIMDLAPGDYTVTVDDGENTAMATVTVGSPEPIGLTATATDASCGEENGTATAMTTGGTGTVTFEWSNGETTAMISNLAPGDYTVTATDENSCTETAMVTVGDGGGIVTVDVTSTDTSCGAEDGTATATPSGGDGNYTYNWSNGETTMTITGLAAGDYDVTVTDGAGCSATGTTTVNQTGNTVAVTTSTTDASACGAEDGTATANATGGDGNYTYNWSNGETTMTITGLAAGTYDVTVTDGAGCSATGSATVNEPPYDEMITLVSPMDGATDVSTTPTLMWDAAPNADSYDVEVSTTADFATIVASSNETGTSYTVSPALMEMTTYFWRVRGVSSCGEGPFSDPFSFTTGEDGGGNDDCMTYTTTDTTVPIQAAGAPVVSQITVPDAGTIFDANVMLDISHTFIGDLTIALVSPAGTQVIIYNGECGGEDDMFYTADDEGLSPLPCPPVDGGAYVPTNPLSAFDGESFTGDWTLTIVDGVPIDDGVLNSWSLILCDEINGGALTVIGTATDETCVGAEDGTATATASGGTGNYTYSWSNGEMGAMISNLAPGDYTVTVDDGENTAMTTVTVGSPDPIGLTATATETSCGEDNGTATAMSTGGTGSVAFTWSNGASGAMIMDLAPGDYTVTATDDNNCTETATVTVEEGDATAVTVVVTSTDATCGNQDGTATATPDGGDGNYTYNWSNGETTMTIENLAGGTYDVTVTDGNGCSATGSATINEPTNDVSIFVESTDASACGAMDGTATASAAGGDGNYSYLWSNGETTAMISNLPGGMYEVTVTDGAGCSAIGSTVVGEAGSTLSSMITSTDPTTCEGTDGTATITAAGGDGNYTYAWSNGETTMMIENLAPGEYGVTVTDGAGCSVTNATTINEFMFDETIFLISPEDGETDVSITPTLMWEAAAGADSYNVEVSTTPDFTDIVASSNETGTEYTVSPELEYLTRYYWRVQGVSDACGEGPFSDATFITGPLNEVCQDYTNSTPQPIVQNGSITLGMNIPDMGTISDIQVIGIDITHPVINSISISLTSPNGTVVNLLSQVCGMNDMDMLINFDDDTPNMYGDIPCPPTDNDFYQPLEALSAFIGEDLNGSWSLSVDGGALGAGTLNAWGLNICTDDGTMVALTVDATATDESCVGAEDGTATAMAMGGTGTYTYTWSNGEMGAMITDLAPGDYTVTVDDGNETAMTTVTVGSPTPIELTVTATETSSCGAADGTATATPSGGDGSFTYEWSNGETTMTIENLTAGNYEVTVTDGTGCTATGSVTVNEGNSDIEVDVTATDATCTSSDGTATATPSGGDGNYSYEWSNGETTMTITGLAAGDYGVTVTDGEGCIAAGSVTVGQTPSDVTVTVTSMDASCTNDDGTATATPSGGDGNYSYEWSNGETTMTIENLMAGTYDVTVTDGNGCSATGSTTVEQTDAIMVDMSSTDATCEASDGTATATPSGGDSPYTYLWSNDETTMTINNLDPGTYSVTVKDANGCIGVDSVEVGQSNSMIAIAISGMDATCGENNGSATANPNGGDGNYSYLWSNGETTMTIEDLQGGTYDVTVTDGNGCTATGSIMIGQADSDIAVTVSGTDAECGEDNGTATANPTGGNGAYTYLWSNGETTMTIENLSAGTYTVTVTDETSCSATGSTTIEQENSTIAVSVTTTDADCSADNGTATANPTGGDGNYSYLWSNGETTMTIDNLMAGSYDVTVTDGNGCTATASATINQANSTVDVSVTTTDADCGTDNGTATANPTGGDGNYSYLWSNGETTMTIDNLMAGTYDVTVTDGNGCTATASATVNQANSTVNVSVTTTDADCGTDNGTATANPTGGDGNYSYLWSNGETTMTIDNLMAGAYDVTVTDGNGCTATASATVNQANSTVDVSVTTTDADCGTDNGTATANPTGGDGNYSYLWSNGETTMTIDNLMAGTYDVTVTDGNGCTATASATVNQANSTVDVSVTTTDADCGTDNGTATANPTGGDGNYSYLWSNGETTMTIDNLMAGTYDVTVTDGNGCTATASATVNQANSTVDVSVTTTDTDCGANNGTATANPTGGDGNYSYNWDNGGTTMTIDNLAPGTYRVTVTDGNGCTATALTMIDEGDSTVEVSITTTDADCGATNGTATANAMGGDGNYSYQWSNGETTMTIDNLAAGIYDVTVTDGNECTATATATVEQANSTVEVSVTGTDADCGAENGTATANTTGGDGNYSYSWSNGETTMTISDLAAGTYTVTVTDGNGCIATGSIEIEQPGSLDVMMSSTDASCGGIDGTATATPSGGDGNYTYEWSNGGNTMTITGLFQGTYSVTVTDGNGCTTTGSVEVEQDNGDLEVTLSSTSATCAAADGSATAMASGGVGNYIYAWSNGENTMTIENIVAGTYSVTVTAGNGCQTTGSVVVEQTNGDVTVTTEATNASCSGDNGSATATGMGGTAPFTYVWSNGDTGATIENLMPGEYFVTASDANGCMATASATVGQDISTLEVEIATTANFCGGENGTATATVTGGEGTITYLWSNDETTQTIGGLIAGTYSVTATDENGCTGTATATIEDDVYTLDIDFMNMDASCGINDGTATAIATNAIGDVSFQWNNNGTDATITDLAPGSYIVTITDSNGCSGTAITTVNEAPSSVMIEITATDATCLGDDGSATAMATGGTPDYLYKWSNDSTENTITNLVPGDYTVTVTDANGCTAIETVQIGQTTSGIDISVTSTPASCEGDDGTATAMATGGSGNYTYEWSNGDTGAMITGLNATTYTVTVTDDSGCFETAQVTVGSDADFTIQLTATDVTCFADNDGTAAVMTDGGQEPFTYFWSDGSISSSTSGLMEGTYFVTVTDATGCMVISSIEVGQSPSPTVTIASTNTINGTNGSAMALVEGGTMPYEYLWSNDSTTQIITNLSPAIYTVTVTDVNGCTGTATVSIEDVTPPNTDYCDTEGSISIYEWIETVTVGDLVNTSGNNGGYGDFTFLTTEVLQGDSLAVSLSPGYSNLVYEEYWRIWIDFNADGDFEDAGEMVFEAEESTTTVTGAFAIPLNSCLGETRMRISMKWGGFPTPCEEFIYGEVEDYTLRIINNDTDGPCTDVQVNANDFEDGWGIWNDGGADCRRVLEDSIYANSGDYCVRLRDNSETSVLTSDVMNLSTFNNVTIDFNYLARSMDNADEDFFLEMSTDGGNDFNVIEEWNTGDEFENGIREFESVTIEGPFSKYTVFRFRMDASGNTDWIYLDDLVISGCTRQTPTVFDTPVVFSSENTTKKETTEIANENNNQDLTNIQLAIYPNPVTNNLTVNYEIPAGNAQLAIFDLTGKVIYTQNLDNQTTGVQQTSIDVTNFNNGYYQLRIVGGKDSKVVKFLKF